MELTLGLMARPFQPFSYEGFGETMNLRFGYIFICYPLKLTLQSLLPSILLSALHSRFFAAFHGHKTTPGAAQVSR
jgi:hypothetical protein